MQKFPKLNLTEQSNLIVDFKFELKSRIYWQELDKVDKNVDIYISLKLKVKVYIGSDPMGKKWEKNKIVF